MNPSTIIILSLVSFAVGICISAYLRYRRDQANFGKIQHKMDLDGIKKFEEQIAALKKESTRESEEYKKARADLQAKIAKYRASNGATVIKPGPGEGTN